MRDRLLTVGAFFAILIILNFLGYVSRYGWPS